MTAATLSPPPQAVNPVEAAARRLDELDHHAREWSGIAAAATAALVGIVDEADREGYVAMFDFRSLEQWVTLRCGIGWAHAKRLILIARGLRGLPEVRERFMTGAISEDHALEIARAGVSAFSDHDAAELASCMTVPQLRKALSFLPPSELLQPTPADDDSDIRDRAATLPPVDDPASPSPTTSPRDPDAPVEWVRYGPEGPGAWGLHVRLTAEHGALVELAIKTGCDREYRDLHGADPDPNDPPAIGQLDGLLRCFHDALDVADPAARAGKAPSDRYLVNIHMYANRPSHLHLGSALDTATRDELCCDTDCRWWTHHRDGTVDLGRRARVVTPRLRTVIEHRDGGCVVPGCDAARRLRVHHIVHWLHHGPTDTHNLVAVCPAHHAQIHKGLLHITGNPDLGTVKITNRHGQPLTIGTPTPTTPERLAAATQVATGSPFRAGEHVNWHWVTWNTPHHPTPPTPKPPASPPPAAPTTATPRRPTCEPMAAGHQPATTTASPASAIPAPPVRAEPHEHATKHPPDATTPANPPCRPLLIDTDWIATIDTEAAPTPADRTGPDQATPADATPAATSFDATFVALLADAAERTSDGISPAAAASDSDDTAAFIAEYLRRDGAAGKQVDGTAAPDDTETARGLIDAHLLRDDGDAWDHAAPIAYRDSNGDTITIG